MDAAILALIGQSLLAEPVRIETIGNARPLIALHHEGNAFALKRCLGGCTTDLPSGKYRIAIARTANTYDYDDLVTVRNGTRIVIDPGAKSERRGLMFLGTSFIGLSLPVLMLGIFGVNGNSMPVVAGVGGLLLGGGVILTIGSASYKPSITASPL